MAVIGINYDGDGKKIKYESVYLHYGNDKEKKFASGNFVKDWYDCLKFCIMKLSGKDNAFFAHSSTVNHFIMDGAPYSSAYLDTKGEPKLVYKFSYEEDRIEFFVSQGTKPTWEELRKLCGDPPKKKKK